MLQARFHDLRHSCAALLVNFGTPLEVVRDILGHMCVRTTARYSHLSVARQTEALYMLCIARFTVSMAAGASH